MKIILALAWHTKFPDQLGPESIVTLLPKRWVKINCAKLAKRTRLLASSLEKNGLPILETQQEAFFRICIDPEFLFINAEAFTYKVKNEENSVRDWRFTLMIASFGSPLGKLYAHSAEWPINENIQRTLAAIEDGRYPETEPSVKSGDLAKSLRDFLDESSRKLGLRKVVRMPNKRYQITIKKE